MKELLIGAALCALFAAPTLAGEPAKVAEPVKLTSSQMDGVTAGSYQSCYWCSNYNETYQTAVAYADAYGFYYADATAVASNYNETDQSINSSGRH